MKELWDMAIQSYNLPLTIGLGFFLLYWIISSVGIFDFDIDIDVDADVDIAAGGSFMGSIMNFVNAMDVPVMFVLSLLNVYLWMGALVSNYYLNPDHSLLVAGGLFIVNFIVSVLAVKLTTIPLIPFFKAVGSDAEQTEPLIGQIGKVKSRVLDTSYGQVEVLRDKAAPALLNCKLSESDESLTKGEEVVIVSLDSESRKYIVRSLSLTDHLSNGKLVVNPKNQEVASQETISSEVETNNI